jgi:hypothetical protein
LSKNISQKKYLFIYLFSNKFIDQFLRDNVREAQENGTPLTFQIWDQIAEKFPGKSRMQVKYF